MNQHATETTDNESINPQTLSWAQHAQAEIRHNTPESLQPQLLNQVEAFITGDPSVAEKKLEQQNLESLIKNARTLNEAMSNYIDRMTPLSQSWMLKEHVQKFWNDFNFEQLETNALQNVLDELAEKVEHSEKEEAITSEARDKIDNELEPEIQSFLPYYFNSKDRGIIYAEMAKLKTIEAINIYRQKIIKARNKREKYVAKKLQEIRSNKHNPLLGQKILKIIQKKCGDGVFQLPHVQEIQNQVNNTDEADLNFKSVHTELEAANQRYKEITGLDHPDFQGLQVLNNNEVLEIKEETSTPEQSVEGVEAMRAPLLKIRDLASKKIALFTRIDPELAKDPNFSIHGGNKIKGLMRAHPDVLGTEEQYFKAEESGSQSLDRARDSTKGFFRYRTFDLPIAAKDCTAEKAAALSSRYEESIKGGEDLAIKTAIFYIGMKASGGSKVSTHSLYEVISHIDHLLANLGGSSVEPLAEAA